MRSSTELPERVELEPEGFRPPSVEALLSGPEEDAYVASGDTVEAATVVATAVHSHYEALVAIERRPDRGSANGRYMP